MPGFKKPFASASALAVVIAFSGACSERRAAGGNPGAAGQVGGGATQGGAAPTGGSQGSVAGASVAAVGGAAAGAAGTAGSGGSAIVDEPPLPDKEQYLRVLLGLVDRLIETQIVDTADAEYGALVSASTNPDPNPTHSRAAEAVYPFAVAYERTGTERYRDAAVALGNWLVGIQQDSGAWGEAWPGHDGWQGTTADQLISLAAAYAILKAELAPDVSTSWALSIRRAADFVALNFPIGPVNYWPTGAVSLVLAEQAIDPADSGWAPKAEALMSATLERTTPEHFLRGEGGSDSIDVGYNVAQSIGYIALYGLLVNSPHHVTRAAELLENHTYFMYPNGAIDNSWGSRSYKWTLESGSKTAPGIYFTYALLAPQNPALQRGAQLALAYLEQHAIDDDGWVSNGPHGSRHASSSPPSNYATFARAQSIAMALEFGTDTTATAAIPADNGSWFKYFPPVKTGVIRTDKLMATLTAYGDDHYPRATFLRGGSATLVWFKGYGPTGFIQASSQTSYYRQEPMHMPTESQLLPLTPRVETTSGEYAANVLDDTATLSLADAGGAIEATSAGELRQVNGTGSGVLFTWKHRFEGAAYSKELQLSSANGLRIVEPFVDNPGSTYEVSEREVRITTADGGIWAMAIESNGAEVTLAGGNERERYWSPFPGFDCYPVVIDISPSNAQPIKYTIRQISEPSQ